MHRRQFLRLTGGALGATLVPGFVGACRDGSRTGVAAHDASIATAWFDRALALTANTPGFSPPVASRAFAVTGVALYETLAPGMRGYRSLAGLLHELPAMPRPASTAPADWPGAANAALARILRLLYATAPASELAAIDALEAAHRSIDARSVSRGRAVADAVFAWAQADGGRDGSLHNFPSDYSGPTGTGLWVPTPPARQPALQPRWGTNRCFRISSTAVGDPGAPLPFSADPSSPFYKSAREVYDAVVHLTDAQRAMVAFWADNAGDTATPAGHAVSILTQVLRARNADLATAAEAYVRLGIAVADAFIACWAVKYRYNLLRPITYINAYIDPAFGPQMPLVTPPFPEYTSGHSVQSGAAAAVLTSMFGRVPFTDHTHEHRGLPPRHFTSFDAAATEAAESRLYGGIHFRPAIERGLAQGRAIGRVAAALPLR